MGNTNSLAMAEAGFSVLVNEVRENNINPGRSINLFIGFQIIKEVLHLKPMTGKFCERKFKDEGLTKCLGTGP
jgi:hypothetical protein